LLLIFFKELPEHRISENERNVSLLDHHVSISDDFEEQNLKRPPKQEIFELYKYPQT